MCPVFHLFLFFNYLQAGISQSQARRLVTPVFRHRQQTEPSTSTSCLLLNLSRHLGNRIGKPSKPTRTLEMVHRGGFSVLSPSGLRYLTVLTQPTSPVTLEYTALLPSCSATSFGLSRDAHYDCLFNLVQAQNKPSNQPLAGLLQPLSTPPRLWSHIALDFVTGLLLSAGNNTILTIVDHFSKAAHFVALCKLSTALETAQLLTTHGFFAFMEGHCFGPGTAVYFSGLEGVLLLSPRSVSLLGFIHRVAGRRSWRPLCPASPHPIRSSGVSSCLGLSMLITPL